MPVEYSAVEWVTWDMTGETLADLAANAGANQEAGQAEWNPRFDYQCGDDGKVSEATILIGWKINVDA
jgi:hypothetical protein